MCRWWGWRVTIATCLLVSQASMIGQMLAADIGVLRAAHSAGLFESPQTFARAAFQLVASAQKEGKEAAAGATGGDRWALVVARLRQVTSLLDLCRGVFVGVDAIETKRQIFGAVGEFLFSAGRFLQAKGPWASPRNVPISATGASGIAVDAMRGGAGAPMMLAAFVTPLHPHEFHRSDRALADGLRREMAAADEAARKLPPNPRNPSLTTQLHLSRWGGQLRVAVYVRALCVVGCMSWVAWLVLHGNCACARAPNTD